jgi:hypothetical protein
MGRWFAVAALGLLQIKLVSHKIIGAGEMWPFGVRRKKAVVVFHIDHNGLAKGAYFRGEADVLIIDERDPKNRVYRMASETPDDELRRRLGRHPLGRLLDDEERAKGTAAPVLNLHWDQAARTG